MATATFIRNGSVIEYSNSGSSTIHYGDIVVVSSIVGVAVTDIPAGDSGNLSIVGVYEFPADNTVAFSAGDKLYWDATNSKATKTATSNTLLGICMDAKATAGTFANVKIG